MKARKNGGVLDSSLNVYGTKNLKVAECVPPSSPPPPHQVLTFFLPGSLSLCPDNLGTNTYRSASAQTSAQVVSLNNLC